MSRCLLLCAFALLFFGCSKKSEKPQASLPVPDSIITEPLMIQIMADVHLMEAGIQVRKNRGINTGPVTEQLYNGLFHKYGISERRFKLNLDHYRSNPVAFEKFYQKVIAELDSRQTRFTIKKAHKED